MQLCRCACLTAPESDSLEAAAKQQATTPQEGSPAVSSDGTHSSLSSASGDSKLAPPSTIAAARGGGCIQRSSREATTIEGETGDGRAQRFVEETAAYGNGSPFHGSPPIEQKRQSLARPDGRQRRRGHGRDRKEEGGENAKGVREACRFPCKALSAQNEIAALTKAMDFFVQARDAFPTTLEHDEVCTADGIIQTIVLIIFENFWSSRPPCLRKKAVVLIGFSKTA